MTGKRRKTAGGGGQVDRALGNGPSGDESAASKDVEEKKLP